MTDHPAPVQPAAITAALDLRGLYGPQVDAACGVAEPTVDLWETGDLTPTVEQLQALARLTGFPVAFFYRPMPDLGPVWVCDRSRRPGNRCKQITLPPAAAAAGPASGRLF